MEPQGMNSFQHYTSEISSQLMETINQQSLISTLNHHAFLTSEETGYSGLSLYFTLALYVLSLPGLFSLVTRSVKVKNVRTTYEIPGPANPTSRPIRQVAAEIMAYFKAQNYEVTTAEDVITFSGVIGRSNSQAAFLTFCTFMGLGSLGLVLSILLPDIGAKAYAIALLSPYAGIFYWNNAQRIEQVQVKMETADDEQTTAIVAYGSKEELERFSKRLNFAEKGKVYVKGLFDGSNEQESIDSGVTLSIPLTSSSSSSSPEE
eukprot:gene10556-14182_t